MLELRGVRKSFGSLLAVDGVDLRVARGQIVGLIGPNGSGKSTLLSTVAGSIRPDSGTIHFDGHDIGGQRPDRNFQLGLARSYQDPSLFFRMSVLDNVLLAARDQRGEGPLRAPFHRVWWPQERDLTSQALMILDLLNLRGQALTPAADLSGGQMKLLELGRTLMGRPRMLLLDEPTAGVAPYLAYEIFDLIERLRRQEGLTFLIVEHRLEILFDYVDTVYVMHLGQIIAQGTPAQVAEDPVVREVYFGGTAEHP
ncbi:MAG: ABC transporter ATP-binding protein [Caldilineaceae bacterium]|nr:ABC transporter ATP-binding protein [Caldilineaceae bacterium]